MHKHLPEYNVKNITVARLLRRGMTDAERKLWSLVRNSQLNVKFRRQEPFGKYVLDFYCPKAKLNIEIDGGQHYTDEGQRQDADRDRYLQEKGIKVLRFSNTDVLQNEDGVIAVIIENIQAQTQTETSIENGKGLRSFHS